MVDTLRRLNLLHVDAQKGLRQWLLVQRFVHHVAAHKEEIKFGSSLKLDLDALTVATESQAQLERDNQKYFERQTELQHLNTTLQDRLEQLKKELEAAGEAVRSAEKRVRSELLVGVEQQVEEMMTVKQKELNEAREQLKKKEWDVKQQLIDVSNQLQDADKRLAHKDVELRQARQELSLLQAEGGLASKDALEAAEKAAQEAAAARDKARAELDAKDKELLQAQLQREEASQVKMRVLQEKLELQFKKDKDDLLADFDRKLQEQRYPPAPLCSP